MRQIIRTQRLSPFSGDLVSFFHGHACVLSEHLRTSSTAPREEAEKVVFADGTGSGRRIDVRLTTIDQTHLSTHRCLPCARKVCRRSPRNCNEPRPGCLMSAQPGRCAGNRISSQNHSRSRANQTLRGEIPLAIVLIAQVPYRSSA